MPKRPPTLAERLRSVWPHEAATRRPSGPTGVVPLQRPADDRATEFAERLRAAAAARR